MGVRPEEVSALKKNLPVKPKFHREIGAGHLSFDCPCSEDQVKANLPSVFAPIRRVLTGLPLTNGSMKRLYGFSVST